MLRIMTETIQNKASLHLKGITIPLASSWQLTKDSGRDCGDEKYAHVTFFFNGSWKNQAVQGTTSGSFSKEVATYDLKPEMSANGVCDKLVEAIKSANTMLSSSILPASTWWSHTELRTRAAIKAIETVDATVEPCGGAVRKWTASLFHLRGPAETQSSWWTMDRRTIYRPYHQPVPFILKVNGPIL